MSVSLTHDAGCEFSGMTQKSGGSMKKHVVRAMCFGD